MAVRLAGALAIGLGTLTVSGIAWAASLGACRAENVGSSSACGPVDDHPLGSLLLGVCLPAVVIAAAVGFGAFTGRWSKARFASMVAWAGYLVVVLVTSPRS